MRMIYAIRNNQYERGAGPAHAAPDKTAQGYLRPARSGTAWPRGTCASTSCSLANPKPPCVSRQTLAASPRRVRRQHLRHVGLRAARAPAVQKAAPPARRIRSAARRFAYACAIGRLHTLVLPDRPVKNNALVRVLDRTLDKPAPVPHRLCRNQNALRVHAVQYIGGNPCPPRRCGWPPAPAGRQKRFRSCDG